MKKIVKEADLKVGSGQNSSVSATLVVGQYYLFVVVLLGYRRGNLPAAVHPGTPGGLCSSLRQS